MPFDMAHDKPGYPAAWEPQSGGVGAASADSSGRAPTHDKRCCQANPGLFHRQTAMLLATHGPVRPKR